MQGATAGCTLECQHTFRLTAKKRALDRIAGAFRVALHDDGLDVVLE
jgi:hypothetical protein